MPYRIAKVSGGFKVKNILTGKTYSKRALPKRRAIRQLKAMYLGGKK